MAFTVRSVMDQRLCFVVACRESGDPMSVLCERHGISRKTGYKWLSRYEASGAAGLEDRSRAPHHRPLGLGTEITEPILRLRAAHPTWGPRKLLARLRLDTPQISWPAASTVGDLLSREGLVRRRGQRRPGPAGHPLPMPEAVNESWSADFKGWFRVGNGVRCEPLTVTDNHSRFLLACQAVARPCFETVVPIFERVFRDYGMPLSLRTDNGSPFGSAKGLGRLTRLSVWLLKRGIRPDWIVPGRPDQNGRHERMHRTLKADAASPPAATIAAQQAQFDRWRQIYNEFRPHEALGQTCPADHHHPSPRLYPERLRPWEYAEDHWVERVGPKGYIKWQGDLIYLTEALAGESVGIAKNDQDDWVIRFRNIDMAILPKNSRKIRNSDPA